MRSGEVSIAYQVVGEGPLDLVWIPGLMHHVELNWENPPVAQFLRRLASVSRLLVWYADRAASMQLMAALS